MKNKQHIDYLYEQFSHRINKNPFFCFPSSQFNQKKFESIHNYCEKYGFILNHSTIKIIQQSLANMITSAFDYGIEQNDQTTDIKLQLTHVNALPSRTERGLFIVMELGNVIEDVRYSLVLLLEKQVPSYEVLHSRGYNLPEEIRKSNGKVLLDQLAIGLKDFLEQFPLNEKLPRSLQLGLLIHFPLKQTDLNHAEILSWSDRFHCPDLLNHNIINLFHQSIEHYLSNTHITIIACIQESVAALISVAFEYPNTFISIIFQHRFQLSFVEDIDTLRSKNIFESKHLRALYQTILSLNFQFLHSNKSFKSHALFQSLLTSIDTSVMCQLNVNYIDIFTCDTCLLEIIRLLIIELCHHEQLLPYLLWSKSKLNSPNSLCLKFVQYLLQRKYSKLKLYLKKLNLKEIKKRHLIFMEYICHIIIRRSTQILSCLIVCLSDRYNEENLTIAIDSYLYRLCPIYQIYMQKEIEYLCKQWITMFHFVNATNKSYVSKIDEDIQSFIIVLVKLVVLEKKYRVLLGDDMRILLSSNDRSNLGKAKNRDFE